MKKITLLLSFLSFSLMVQAQTTGTFTKSISWTNASGAQTRSTRVYVPSTYNSANSYKLIIGLHGLGDNPNNYMMWMSLFANDPFFGNVIIACPSEGSVNTSWFVSAEDFDIVSGIINDLDARDKMD